MSFFKEFKDDPIVENNETNEEVVLSVETEEDVAIDEPVTEQDDLDETVDAELLDITGGIVQGMSGSPILQNGRIVGAVTHVFVNDPTRGYGLFMDWML